MVYWHYSFYEYDDVSIDSCEILRISRDKVVDYLNLAYKGLVNYINDKHLNLNLDDLNPNKCAACAYNKYCGHKTKRYKQVTIPYQRSYLKLFRTPFPEILKQDSTQSDKSDIYGFLDE